MIVIHQHAVAVPATFVEIHPAVVASAVDVVADRAAAVAEVHPSVVASDAVADGSGAAVALFPEFFAGIQPTVVASAVSAPLLDAVVLVKP